MDKLELLPKGGFKLRATDDPPKFTEYQGRFSMYAMDVFMRQTGIESYMNLMERISVGMSIGEYADLIHAGLNDMDRCKERYTRAQVMDIIDSVFDGILGEDFKKLIFHAIGRVAALPQLDAGAQTDQGGESGEEKKSD